MSFCHSRGKMRALRRRWSSAKTMSRARAEACGDKRTTVQKSFIWFDGASGSYSAIVEYYIQVASATKHELRGYNTWKPQCYEVWILASAHSWVPSFSLKCTSLHLGQPKSWKESGRAIFPACILSEANHNLIITLSKFYYSANVLFALFPLVRF